MQFDTSKEGLETLFFPWQVAMLEEVFRRKEAGTALSRSALTSRDLHDYLRKHKNPDFHISRASIINFLEYLTEEKILERDEESCKGGSRGLYTPSFSRKVFEEFVARKICGKLSEVFPGLQLLYHF